MPKILQEQRTPSNNKRISLASTNFSFFGRISLLATAMSVLKILAYSKDLSGPKAPCSQMVSPQDKKNCKTVSDLYQRHKLVHMLTLSKKLNGFICVLTNSKPQTGHVTWSRKKLSLWAIVDSLDLTEELMWKSGVFLFTLATAGNNFIVIRKNKICLIVISQKNLREFAGKRLDRWLK